MFDNDNAIRILWMTSLLFVVAGVVLHYQVKDVSQPGI